MAFLITQSPTGITQSQTFAILFVGFASLNQMSQLFMDIPQRWIITRQLMVKPNEYYRVNNMYHGIDRGIYSVLIFFASLQFGFLTAIVFALFPIAIFLFVEGYTRFVFEKTQMKLSKSHVMLRLVLSVLLGVITISGLFVPALQYVSLLLLIGVIALGIRSLQNAQCFDDVQRYMIQFMEINRSSEDIIEQTNKDQLKVDDDIDLSQSVNDSLTGYKYLNALFFKRHRRLWYKTLKQSLYIFTGSVLLISAARILGQYLFPEVILEFTGEPLQILKLTGPLLFVLFYSNRTQILTKSMYLNCDYALLHYPFYRQPQYMWKQYLVRLRTIMLINMIQPLLMILFIIFAQLIGFISFVWIDAVYLAINLVSGSFIVSALYLSLYYMFQPFNKKMNIKNGFYSFFSGIMTFFFLYARTSIEVLALEVWIFPLLFVVTLILSLIGVRLLGPKNFQYKD